MSIIAEIVDMEKFCVNDNCYNVAKQLSKKLEFLNHVDRYIEDSKKEGKENSKNMGNDKK